MSAVYGCVQLGDRPVVTETLRAMEAGLHHWHADDRDIWHRGRAGLGHLMLYNTPESLQEKLPLHNAPAGLTITADARIDNRDEIIHRLDCDRTAARHFPDSTLILMLYERFGADCVHYLAGDFAFAVWDEKKQLLFCARDQMGVKPFFYYHDRHLFAFATEQKGILALPEANRDIDEGYLYSLLFPQHDYSDTETLYRHIKRLAPAHTLTVDVAANRLHIRRYWTLDVEKRAHHSRAADYIEELRHHFEIAVQCRLRSHYPIAAELSGGLDSSSIVGVACASGWADRLITLSNVIAPGTTDETLLRTSERPFIDDVIRFHGIRNPVFITENIWDDPLEEADFVLKLNDGPQAWEGLWQVPAREAARRRQVRTVLSGFPGDQLVTNKGWHDYVIARENTSLIRYLRDSRNYEDLNRRLWSLMPYSIEYGYRKARNLFGHFRKDPAAAFVIPLKYRLRHGDNRWSHPYFRERFQSYRHFLRAALIKPRVGLRMEGESRCGLYFGHEPRFPMADIRLAQYYLSIPDTLKVAGSMSRETFRKAARSYLPDSVYFRDSKAGNLAPFRSEQDAVRKQQEAAHQIAASLTGNGILKLRKKSSDPGRLSILRWLQQKAAAPATL